MMTRMRIGDFDYILSQNKTCKICKNIINTDTTTHLWHDCTPTTMVLNHIKRNLRLTREIDGNNTKEIIKNLHKGHWKYLIKVSSHVISGFYVLTCTDAPGFYPFP